MEFLGLLIFILIMLTVMKHAFKTLGFGFLTAKDTGTRLFNPFTQILRFIFNSAQPSGMMSNYETNKLFSHSNKGLVLNGTDKRLSLKNSFNHLALISRTGGGKTTTYVIPNILKLSKQKSSMVITDISGELYQKTSGHLAKNGYKIYVLNPEDLNESIAYNPLYYATDSTKIDSLVNILIKSSKSGSQSLGGNDNSEFWENGAKSLISILIKILISTKSHKHINLANVRYLINNYGHDGESLFDLVDNFADDKTYHEFRGFIKGNPQTILSMVSTANVALSPIGINDNLEKLTSNHSINFENFRKEKSVIYIKIPEQKQDQYRFLLNIFYHQFFSTMMEKIPSKNDLPIFCLLDEFGNMNLPNFETTITTARKYQISISIILQNIKQLENKYGKANAETILEGGVASKLFFSGADLPTTEMLSKILGNKEEFKSNPDGTIYVKDKPIMTNNEIRTMKDNEALFIMTNKLPVKLKITPYYEDFRLNRHTKEAPYKIQSNINNIQVEYIDLDFDDNDNNTDDDIHEDYEE
jgi:type IV secretory pathway TraG/TraD family ATPase VirD4